MERNTIIAILLSAVVLIASMVLEFTVFLPKQQAAAEKQRIEQEIQQQKQAEVAKSVDESISTYSSGDTTVVEEYIPEQQYTIKTDKVEAVFTNRGGDLISYTLLDHIDKDTGKGVQMVDNVTDTNRAFALAFGDSNSSIVNEVFNVKQENENTIVFTRDFEVKDYLGIPHRITLLKSHSSD